MENEATSAHDPVARGNIQEVKKFKFLATLHLLDDVIFLLTKLSKVFQKENVDFSIIAPMVQSTIEAVKTQPGPILQQFWMK